ncbi:MULTISPECIES: AI-2E family transporter [unclassified Arcicella]|uniref:AI-2E family transporter n=1 Tax=unclassified Arcicella TaxID=2644986 RepID=UPI0028549C1D|nr:MULTISPECIES: AI-2E family transporter [unclassified Arcicella]MDR6562354.1 putative PurR-regulated permease PerM [Arcicella sp. BE51]MDR6812248.1 putative PurR-regulated permease PerM [Arcicella sp. BE140]MDR6823579.1 putative PurR-regulated permease PerM [Arcicella sp. BE139]
MTITNTSIIKKILLLFLVLAGMYFAKEFLIPLLIGSILATLFIPLCNYLEKKGLPKGLSAFICLLVLVLIMASLIALLGWKVAEVVKDMTEIKQKAIKWGVNAQEYIFNHLGISVEEQSKILKQEQPSLSSIMQLTLSSITALFTALVLLLAYVFFLLYYRNHIKQFFMKLASPSQQHEVGQILSKATNVSQQYLFGLSKMIACLWIMYGIGFSVLGVKNAIFFAILCGLLEIVPFVGNITGTTLTILVTALHGASPSVLGGIAVVYGIVQFIQGWVLEPLILGPQVKINPLFTIIALVVGELIWGIPGIILAIPLTAILKIVCDHIDPLKPYGFLIGEIDYNKDSDSFITKLKQGMSKLAKNR